MSITENQLRGKLAEIDLLRHDAQLCEDMHTHWMGHDGELVEVTQVTVRRRWRTGERMTHSERVMPISERDLFLSWLYARARQLNDQADALAATLSDVTP